MAWYNPATWTPVDAVQNKISQSKNALGSFQGSSPVGPRFSNPTGQSNTPLYTQGSAGGRTDVMGSEYTPQASGAGSDPYAKYGGRSGYDRLMSGFDTQKQNIYGTSRESAQNAALGRQSSILDFIQGLRSGQQSIDERGVQNELAKRQGTSSVMDMVGRGIRSGGTMLAGKNASDSSAAEGISRAYGDIGQRELSSIGNQYELENRNIGMAQSDFDTQRQTGLRKFDESKLTMVNSIVGDARNRLAELDAAMAEADVPTRVAIEQEKEAIKAEAISTLSQFDQQLSQGASGVQATSSDDRRRTAADLANRGTASSKQFDFTSQMPAQFQNTGPFASELPLFTLRRPRTQEA
jgi:hypothetical protein